MGKRIGHTKQNPCSSAVAGTYGSGAVVLVYTPNAVVVTELNEYNRVAPEHAKAGNGWQNAESNPVRSAARKPTGVNAGLRC